MSKEYQIGKESVNDYDDGFSIIEVSDMKDENPYDETDCQGEYMGWLQDTMFDEEQECLDLG